MAFDQSTRNRLQKFVSDARSLLSEEFTRQLQNDYGLDLHSGTVTPIENLGHLDDTRRETARILRDTLAHYLASSPSGGSREALDRIVREQAFTVLNRLAALRMAESRGILIESVGNGYQSKGFQLYERLAGPGLGETGDTYRCYLFSIFDEFALDLKVLFDRFSPHGRLFPRETALLDLLKLLNDPGLAHLWAEDETIGWIYQYFNPKEERKKMRDESAAPRNSRELAVRNQFFTPRYVVEFLTDNTLGRIWYEMTQGETVLKESCRYLVRRPAEIFLKVGENAPDQSSGDENLSQEELLKQPVYIQPRLLKDPRTLRMLDPACGSMHFGLYAFDLYEQIYDEAWELELRFGPKVFVREDRLRPLTESYSDRGAFIQDIPRLIIEHNIHGIDIDPRAAQIAGLSLWLRAQRSWHNQGVKPVDRPRITRSNIVFAEPMPGEKELLREFTARLEVPALGYLLEQVFDKMQLAGEAGSLLKIEEEIRDIIAEAKGLWKAGPKLTQMGLFGDEPSKPDQGELPLDFTGITDERFWEGAEEKLYHALQEYAEVAGEHGYQRRLFAEDAARGFAFIDLCRKRYDVALMNPPFGEQAKTTRDLLGSQYPLTKHDLFAAFAQRALSLLEDGGLIGEISSRVGFFIKSFENWRKEVLGKVTLPMLADLGMGVLDDATVEAACYVIYNRPRRNDESTLVFRLLTENDKEAALLAAVADPINRMNFVFRAKSANCLPLEPWIYWVPSSTKTKLSSHPALEPSGAVIRQGLGTGDNNRFVRAIWEVPPQLIGTAPTLSNNFRQQFSCGKRWSVHVRSGSSQPWYSPFTLLIDWENQGLRLKEHWRSKGESPSRYIPSEDLYFRPGFSWTLRAFRLIPYLIPGGCIPSASRYMGFPKKGYEFSVLGLTASNISSCFSRFYGEMFERPKHLVDTIKRLPYVDLPESLHEKIRFKITGEVDTRRKFFRNFEPFWDFLLPSEIYQWSDDNSSSWNPITLLGKTIEVELANTLSLTAQNLEELEYDLMEAAQVRRKSKDFIDTDETDGEEDDSACDTSNRGKKMDLVSYLIGCTLGRWDIRFATGEKTAPDLSDPFAPLPACPPGMLQNAQGFPAVHQDVPDAYPLRISWSGILVDDDRHQEDISGRIHEAIEVVWKEKSGDLEHEACEILGVRSLRDYFGKPSGFFTDHLKRYSKSRRQAPIYWPLSTPSGSYTLWIYYHRLSDQTLYTCVMDYVEPKLRDVAAELGNLRQKGGGRTRDDEKKLEKLQDFETELQEFRDELLRLTRLPWKPNLNDGVQITAAPLWRLFQLPKWKKTLKETWEKLEKGEYDWAHLAYSIWPDRVKKKCVTDKSLAIAHDLEELYEESPASAKKKRSKKTAVVEEDED